MKTIRMAFFLAALACVMITGCGGEPIADDGVSAANVTAAGALPACDPALVGGSRKCGPLTVANDQPVALMECTTYAFAPDGTYQGITPVSGCTLDFVARAGVPYTATCVAVCPTGAP